MRTGDIVTNVLLIIAAAYSEADATSCCEQPGIQLTVDCTTPGEIQWQWNAQVPADFGFCITYDCQVPTNGDYCSEEPSFPRKCYNTYDIIQSHNVNTEELKIADGKSCWFWIKDTGLFDFDDSSCSELIHCNLSSPSLMISEDNFNTTIEIQDVTDNRTVGDLHEIQCKVYTDKVVNASIINITWIGPNNDIIVTNNRINITATTSADNNHTSTLQFLYLTEEDEGLYTCHIAILNNYNDSGFLKLENFSIPIPDVNVTILENKRKTVGSTLSLKCNVTTVMGISSSVEILWIKNGTIVNETNNSRIKIFRNDSTHTSILQFSYLSEDDESNYTCSAMIRDNNNSKLIELSNFDIPIPDVNVTILENKRKTVGSTLSLKCNVTTVMGISSNVEILWIKNGTIVNETNNGRIRIFRNDSTHTSILQFSYLSEGDESNYTCSAMIHDSNNSKLIELSNFDIPKPSVSVTAVNQNVGDLLSLKCDVSIVRGITSDVNITWTANGNKLESYNGNVIENTTAYTYYYDGTKGLTLNDNYTIYQCQVTINNRSQESDTLTLQLNVTDRDFTPSASSAPSDETTQTVTIISIISIIIVLILLCFVIFIGIMYQTKRNKNVQVARHHATDHKAVINQTTHMSSALSHDVNISKEEGEIESSAHNVKHDVIPLQPHNSPQSIVTHSDETLLITTAIEGDYNTAIQQKN